MPFVCVKAGTNECFFFGKCAGLFILEKYNIVGLLISLLYENKIFSFKDDVFRF